MKKVLITGGTGLVGSHLAKELLNKGYHVSLLSRKGEGIAGLDTYRWDPLNGIIDKNALAGKDIIIHLAGAGIGTSRWSAGRKELIINSRVKGTGLLLDTVRSCGYRPGVFISASATGYYGTVSSEQIFNEDTAPGHDFTARVCRLWEDEAEKFTAIGTRVVCIRTGVVLDKNGGALAKMMVPANMGIASAIGKGTQYIPWIHNADLTGIYLLAAEKNNIRGPYNAVAPQHITNREFTRIMAGLLGKPFRKIKVPQILLKLLYGEMSVIVLEGSRVSSEKIREAGYNFKYPDTRDALDELLKRNS